MPGAQQVIVTATTATAPAITTPSFSVGAVIGFHQHYAARQRTYPGLAAMISDGFTTQEPLYRMAAIYFSQSPSPAQLVVGRRANAYTQTLDLLLTDATSGDLYSFQAIGSDDVVHPISLVSTGVTTADATSITAFFAATGGPVTQVGTGPAVTFTGTALANETIVITITTGGTVAGGSARYQWSLNGTVQATGVTVATGPVALGSTGLSVNFASGTTVVNTTYTVVAIINCGTVSTSTSTVVFTQTAGKLTDIVGWLDGPVQNIQVTDATADPGITADLAAIYAAGTLSFYGFAIDSNSKAEVLAALAWANSQGQGPTGKFFFSNNSDAADVNMASISTNDVFATAESASYGKGTITYSGQEILGYHGVSEMSYALSKVPGYYVMADKSLPGCLTDTDTSLTLSQALVLNTSAAGNPATGGKNGNYYVNENGQNVLWPGVCPNGQYIDYPIWLDYIDTQIQASVLAAKSGPPKASYDAHGLQLIYSAILAPLNAASTPDANGNVAILRSSIVVFVPTLAEISQASILNRDLPNATWACTYVGGIQTVTATGVVTL